MPRILPERVVAAGHVSSEILAGFFFCFAERGADSPRSRSFRRRVCRAIPSSRAAWC